MGAIEGDSDEYWFLAEAVQLSKDVEGMCLELGLRLGLGTKVIIDAVREFCPGKLVVSVDPYGNIPYTGREPDGETHYDYTDDMRNECMVNMWQVVRNTKTNYRFFNLSDYDYFELFSIGVPFYDYNGRFLDTLYSTVHLDAQHTVDDITRQINWFNDRMLPGATIVIDDVTPDFIDFKPIKQHLIELGFEHIKIGNKKSLWRKL